MPKKEALFAFLLALVFSCKKESEKKELPAILINHRTDTLEVDLPEEWRVKRTFLAPVLEDLGH